MKNIAIVGATGYVGEELVRLLLQHPKVQIKKVLSNSYKGEEYTNVYPQFKKHIDLICEEELKEEDIDVVFLGLPHGLGSKWVDENRLKDTKIIDLGADFRMSYDIYKNWYQEEHGARDLIKEAVYGLTEWERENIKNAKLIANPGCYVTAALLTLLPLIKEMAINPKNIIIDAKSGITGAGRALSLDTHYTECNENIKAYSIGNHRHKPEIRNIIQKIANIETSIVFTPHLIPMNRGILTTIYLDMEKDMTEENIRQIYKNYYEHERFIRILDKGQFAQTKWVKGSNYCDISFKVDEDTKKLICITAIDNIMKGAAGQAVQNMNVLMGWEESLGLEMIPPFPI